MNCFNQFLQCFTSNRPESLRSGLFELKISVERRVRRLMINCSVEGM
jgi:hypothetical protein